MSGKSNLDPLDQFMDIACELPQTLDSATRVILAQQSNDSEVHIAVTALWTILQGLYTWQAGQYSASPTPLYTAVPSRLDNPSDANYDTKLFPFVLEFNSLQTATHHVLSWALQLHICFILQRIAEARGEAIPVPSEFVDLTNSFDSMEDKAANLARCICQSVEYCYRIEMGTFGPQTMVYPQWITRQFFAQCGANRELQWCNDVGNMSGTGTRCGIRLMTFQSSIAC
jgi:hypothetical protein